MIPKNLIFSAVLGGAVLGTAAVYFLPPPQVILGLCGAALVVAVLFFWNSLRTLGGDTDILDEALRTVEHGPLEAMIARKKMLLLSLKDLDNERQLGKILPADFEDVSYRYREEVKALMRQIDAAAEPYRARAEELAGKHLREQGLMPRDDQKAMADAERDAPEDARGDEPNESDETDEKPASSAVRNDEPVDSRAITKPNATPNRPSAGREAAHATDRKSKSADEKVPEQLITTKKSLDIDPATLEAGGPSVRSPSVRRPCPSCSASNEPDAKFCKECATPLRAKDRTSAAPPQRGQNQAESVKQAEPATEEMRDEKTDEKEKTEGATDDA